MQIVIDINEETYEYMTPKDPREMTNKKAAEWFVVLHKAIFVNGKVLPKGHGALKDTDKLAIAIAMIRDTHNAYGNEYDRVMFQAYDYCVDKIIDAPTIIEADEEGEEE